MIRINKLIDKSAALLLLLYLLGNACMAELRGTGDLGVVIERERGSVLIIETSKRSILGRVGKLGDLSHASVVFSRDQRYAYVFGRDGGLNKIDLLQNKLVRRVVQAGNSIGGAISQDGRFIAVANYQPGGVKIFTSDTLKLVADIPAVYGDDKRSRVVGLVDAPGRQFVYSLFDAGEIWLLDMRDPSRIEIQKFSDIGRQPYDALLTPDGRYYLAGLFGETGLALLDLWHPEEGVKRILPEYGKDDDKLPVYKMPHMEGWAVAGNLAFVPAVGLHQVLVIDMLQWRLLKSIPVAGQPVFVMARPDGRQIWVNFAFPDNQQLQVIDAEDLTISRTLQPGKGVLHMEFTPRGEEVWVSVRDDNQILVYDTRSFQEMARLPAVTPSGIFFTARATKTGL